MAVLTDHPTGLIRIIPYRLHLWVDRAVGVVFVSVRHLFEKRGFDLFIDIRSVPPAVDFQAELWRGLTHTA
ncbi:hypothetical protein AB0V79_32435 [Mesorhizobium ciceri]|uniref:hypothetical protein n=1 Tax=Mesorhizobium TaxID=68287 RepID=UPI000A5DB3C1|nr:MULTISPECIES: hypothetical protein [Mesorhizobium]MDF3233410.1 hypothetical protein [Mesorhizobium sp. DSM 30133]